MLSKPLLILMCLIVVLGGLFFYKKNRFDAESTITIGIIQTATHPALDQAREGFITEITKLSNGMVSFVIQNAEGSLSQAQSIAESFHAHKKINAIFAIGTPAVQAIARAEKQKPIFIAAVSDPESLGVIYPGSNVCGTTDQVDSDAQADLILKIVPAAQTVVIIYNPGENNSQVMVKKMQHSLQERGLKNITFGVHSENEIVQTITTASRKGQVILVPADNLLVGAMPLVAKEALKNGRPLFASDIPSVTKGALIAQGADYSDLGKETAEMAYQVLLLGKKPQEVGIIHPRNSKILINKQVVEDLQISIPQELLPSITLIGSGGGSDAS